MSVSQPPSTGFKAGTATAEIPFDDYPQLLHPLQRSIYGSPAEPGGDCPGPVINLSTRRMLGFQTPKSRPDCFPLPGVFQSLLAKEMRDYMRDCMLRKFSAVDNARLHEEAREKEKLDRVYFRL